MSKPDGSEQLGVRRIEIDAPEEAAAAECPFAPADYVDVQAAAEAVEQEEQATEEEMAKLQDLLTDLEHKCAFAEDQHLRVVAELQNYKRRVQQEKEQLTKYALEGVVVELIPVLDNFERAMEVKVDSPGAECLMAGVRMIYEQLQSALAGHGVQRIEALGQDFDPHLHDAVEREPSSALPPNVVVAELAKGYQLSGRVLRPAKVRVTVAPATEAD
jgi:molecular chaperone GrpE